MAEIDREAARRDYEAGMSQRAVALKYGVSKSAVAKWAKRGGWTVGTSAHGAHMGGVEPVVTAVELPESTGEHERLRRIGLKLLDRVDLVLDEAIQPKDLRAIAATLLDVRQLLNAVSPVEAEEQRLRIEGLRREAEQAAQTREPVEIKFIETGGAEA